MSSIWLETRWLAAMSVVVAAGLVSACCSNWTDATETTWSPSRVPSTRPSSLQLLPGATGSARRGSSEPIAPASKMPFADPGPKALAVNKETPAPAPATTKEKPPTPVASIANQFQSAPMSARSNPTPAAADRTAAVVTASDLNVEKLAADLAAELSTRCSFSGAADDVAFTDCQRALSGNSKIRTSLAATALWGQGENGSGTRLVRPALSEASKDDLAGQYLPLFMFSGRHIISFSETDKLYRVEFGARLRNRLPPARFPHSVRQQDDSWEIYQRATGVVVWVDPQKLTIGAAQHVAESSVGNGPSEPAPKPAH